MNSKQYKEAFDQIKVSDQLIKETIAMKNKVNHKSSKLKTGAIILAATIGVGSIPVLAYQFNVGDLFSKAFKQSTTSSENYEKKNIGQLETMGYTESSTLASNDGLSLVLLGVAGDSHSAYLMVEAIADEGVVLDKDYCFESVDSSVGMFGVTQITDDQPDDNKITFLFDLTSETDLTNQMVQFDLSNLSYFTEPTFTSDMTDADIEAMEPTYTPVIKANWHLQVPLNYSDTSKELNVNLAYPTGDDNLTLTVEKIRFSPISFSVYFTYPSEGNADAIKEYIQDKLDGTTMKVCLKNGTVLDWKSPFSGSLGNSVENGYQFTTIFGAPINPEDITSFGVGELEIPNK